jgi:hypothetical protein
LHLSQTAQSITPAEFVVSHNLHRRHLTVAQRAFAAEEMANISLGEVHRPKEGSAQALPSEDYSQNGRRRPGGRKAKTPLFSQ